MKKWRMEHNERNGFKIYKNGEMVADLSDFSRGSEWNGKVEGTVYETFIELVEDSGRYYIDYADSYDGIDIVDTNQDTVIDLSEYTSHKGHPHKVIGLDDYEIIILEDIIELANKNTSEEEVEEMEEPKKSEKKRYLLLYSDEYPRSVWEDYARILNFPYSATQVQVIVDSVKVID